MKSIEDHSEGTNIFGREESIEGTPEERDRIFLSSISKGFVDGRSDLRKTKDKAKRSNLINRFAYKIPYNQGDPQFFDNYNELITTSKNPFAKFAFSKNKFK